MTAFLPPNLLALFAPRDPISHLPPPCKLSHEKKRLSYGTVANYLKEFEDPKDTPPPTRVETKEERTERKKREKSEQVAYKLEQDLALWDPLTSSGDITKDAFKTLFIARINYDTSESKLRREFESFGSIRKIRLVCNEQNSFKPRGYAFIEYERERDMHNAYKNADGKKIDGRRVLVDVERGRTVKGWRPRRLGGGLGGTRRGAPDENTKFSGRDDGSKREEGAERRGEDERGDRRRRSKSRERRERRSRSRGERRRRSRERKDDRDEEEKKRKRSRRSRSKDRPRRSKSREKKRRRSKERGGDREKGGVSGGMDNPEQSFSGQPEEEYNMPVHDYGHGMSKGGEGEPSYGETAENGDQAAGGYQDYAAY